MGWGARKGAQGLLKGGREGGRRRCLPRLKRACVWYIPPGARGHAAHQPHLARAQCPGNCVRRTGGRRSHPAAQLLARLRSWHSHASAGGEARGGTRAGVQGESGGGALKGPVSSGAWGQRWAKDKPTNAPWVRDWMGGGAVRA